MSLIGANIALICANIYPLMSLICANTTLICANYHEDFFTPGISPLFANSLKHILHKPNFLIYPLFLPHLKHRFTFRVENLGGFCAFAINDFLGI